MLCALTFTFTFASTSLLYSSTHTRGHLSDATVSFFKVLQSYSAFAPRPSLVAPVSTRQPKAHTFFDEGDCRGRYRQDREQEGPGVNQRKGKHVDVSQPSETASTVLAIVGGDAEESMDMVRSEAEEAQNTLTAEMLSGSLFDDHADQHNQLPDEFVVSIELKEQKQTEDLVGMQAHRHELQILLPRSSDESDEVS